MAQHIDPRLLSLMEQSEGISWIFVRDLLEGDILEVQTVNTLYTMKVVDPEKSTVLVNSNGRHITKETRGTVEGSSLTGTGTMMKISGIAIDLRLCLFLGGMGELLLSATEEVRVNGTKLLHVEIPDWKEEIEDMESIGNL